MSSTGHPVGDAVVPAAMQLVCAVHDGDSKAITEAIGQAMTDTDAHPYWMTALVLVLAGMVPDDRRLSDLLAWNEGVA